MARKGSGTCSCQESLSRTLTLIFPVTEMGSTEQIVQLPLSRKPLRGRFSLHNRQQPKGTSYRNAQAKAWQGGGGGVPREASSLRTGPTSGLGSSRQHRPLHPQGLQTLQPKGPPQSAWQGKGPSARVSCLEGSRGPGRAESRRLLAPGVSQ